MPRRDEHARRRLGVTGVSRGEVTGAGTSADGIPAILSALGQTEVATDDHPLDLAGALADLEDLGVAVEPGDRVLLHEAVAAEDLRRDTRRGDRGLRGVELGDRGRLLDLGDRAAPSLLLVLSQAAL